LTWKKEMLQEAIQWIHRNHLEGHAIPITDKSRSPYPEVTGYYIPTLLSIGEIALAEGFARWLVSVQNPDGSFSLTDKSQAFVFDTGQVIRGWVSIIDRLPELTAPLQRACDWIVQGADPVSGRFQAPAPGGAWSLGPRGEVSEGIHLYVLQPLRDAAAALNRPDIRAAADKALQYYLATVPATDFSGRNMLSHFYGYMQEAFFELGCIEEARRGMASAAAFQLPSGAVPAYSDVPWVCSTGLAQLAKVWYFLGDLARADRAMAFLAQLQNASGGFYGSYGVAAAYFPAEEISWAVKYWIEAEQLRIERHFDTTAPQYAPTISVQDGRVQAILAELGEAGRVLDAGCGKGRYAALVRQQRPASEVHAVDLSAEMLRHVPAGIRTRQASIQDLPYPDGHFDLVYCVEALEHVPNPDAALAELSRVLAPGGRLVIVDKNKARQGALRIEAWERWFGVEELGAALAKLGLAARARFVGYDGRQPDGLFVAWAGTKPGAVADPVNFYRESCCDEANAAVLAAARRGDRAWIAAHLAQQHARQTAPYADELFENRVGMQLVAQLLQKAGMAWDVVDIGCGNASLLHRLRADGHRAQGVDASPIRAANNRDVPLLQAFAEALPLADASADVVISLETLNQVCDLGLALREAVRVLRPGGLFLAQVPQGRFADGSNNVRLFDAPALRSAVTGAGLEVFDSWQIAYLVGEKPNNLFIAARRPGGPGAATALSPVFAALSAR
jgi:malonyl-CoA O-methyltransferase